MFGIGFTAAIGKEGDETYEVMDPSVRPVSELTIPCVLVSSLL